MRFDADFIDDKEQMGVPGPGRYTESIADSAGKTALSKFRSAKTPNLLSSTSKRFGKPSNDMFDADDNPGPGNYFR